MYGYFASLAMWWLLLLGGLLLGVVAFVLIGLACASLPGLGRVVTLDCPHCGVATPAHLPNCTSCGRSFRDDVPRPGPVVDSPKLR